MNHQELMKLAYKESEKSVANRLKVGAIIYYNNLVIASGYNHMPEGYPIECDHQVFIDGKVIRSESYDNVIHAEVECILTAAKHGISLYNTVLYITDSPCLRCAELIKAVGIKTVIYDREYRIKDGLEYLKKVGVNIYKLSDL